MAGLQPIERVSDLRLGDNPVFDAWFYTFRAENNIEHDINPAGVASIEQLRFMVALSPRQVYVPCSDVTFQELVTASIHSSIRSNMWQAFPESLLKQYIAAWRSIVRVVRRIPDREQRWKLIHYCRHRFRGSLVLGCILPSRLVKRLITTLLSQSETDEEGSLAHGDPWCEERQRQNQRIISFLRSEAFIAARERLPESSTACATLTDLRRTLDCAELTRLFWLAGHSWKSLVSLMDQFAASTHGEGLFANAADLLPTVSWLLGSEGKQRTFLYLCDQEGGLALDLQIIAPLLRLGHKVVLCVKDMPLYCAPTLWDVEHDPLWLEHVPETTILRNPAVSKNELLQRLRESRLLIISDGTGERLNLYRTSVTFARAWKESDVIVARGRRNKDVLLGTSHLFTRDIVCFWEEEGQVRMERKAHAPDVQKFSEQTLLEKAGRIIKTMRAARDSGKSVMFYSCIIGSIPGQTQLAIQVAETFVGYLRQRLDDLFIINPAEYFEAGMDGDDLMFMWEKVQRSGFINIWRFQSVEDIEISFSLLERKVPPLWSGKDATYSTGCTKEMRIALDVQRAHPELQIIGPAPERFFRRSNYGVGKFFDATLTSIHQDIP